MDFKLKKNYHIYRDMHKALVYFRDNQDKKLIDLSTHLNNAISSNVTSNKEYSEQLSSFNTFLNRSKEIIDYFIDQSLILEKDKRYRISIKGILFLNKGGFNEQFNIDKDQFRRSIKNEKRLKIKDNVVIVCLILSGFISLLSIINSCK